MNPASSPLISGRVISPDGTPIAYKRSGSGSPLILVPGTGAANPSVWPAAQMLEEHSTIYAVDRRGRGESGDGAAYAIEREFEDLAAVVDSLGEPANLLGHSFGALCALEAALLTNNLGKLILYEPSIPRLGVPVYAEGFIDSLERLLEKGDREGVLTTHYRDNVGMTSEEIEQVRLSPAWPARVATAHTLPREMRAEERYVFDAQRFKDLQTPTLLLLGSESPPAFKDSAQTIAAALPNSRVSVLPGQQHLAMYTAPDLFVLEVLAFLKEAQNVENR